MTKPCNKNQSWPLTPLSKILSERTEKPCLEDILEGKIPIISKINFEGGQIQLRNDCKTKTAMILIRPGDLILSGINACKGAIAIYYSDAKEPIAATIHYSAYIPNKDKVEVKFLWWLLRSEVFREILNQYLPGGIKTELKAKRFLRIPIPLPSLLEQQWIVKKIEELAIRIEKAKKLRNQSNEQVETLRSRAVDFLIDKSASPREPLERFLAEPLLNGLSLPASNMGSGTLFARVGVVNTGVFNSSETKLCNIHLPPNSPYWLRCNDIVVSRGNTIGLVGRAAVYDGIPPKCAIPDLLIRIRVVQELLDPKFLAFFFHSNEARQYIESRVTGTSPTMKKISQQKLRVMQVPVPSLAEQRHIVAYLNDLQCKAIALKRLQAETLAELDALIPSVLAKAFRGEL